MNRNAKEIEVSMETWMKFIRHTNNLVIREKLLEEFEILQEFPFLCRYISEIIQYLIIHCIYRFRL